MAMTLVRNLQGRSPPVAGEAFRAAMRNLAGGASIVAAGEGDGRRGLTVTAVTAVTVAPPTLAVFVNQTADAHDVIKISNAFCVSVLSEQHVEEATLFSGQLGLKGAIRFQPMTWDRLATGAPALTTAIANIDCEVIECIGLGSHTMFLGQVVDTRCNDLSAPLVYLRSAFHSPHPVPRMPE